MHIPDGYLGPSTYLASYAVVIPLWTISYKKLKAKIDSQKAPLLAITAAFSFLIMMFNVPIPGGTTGHAVGAVLIAIFLGPWAASLALSVALFIQAFMFGDGGITSLGANCLNMAFIMPFSGYLVYQLLSKLSLNPVWNGIFAGIAGWVGLNLAALSTAVMFGIQPIIYPPVDGQTLYSPFSLEVAVPAVMAGHLVLFGLVEGLITGIAIYFIRQSNSVYERTI